ncbi:hypothetical protein GCK72_013426 [Caenorhabditis remanei]|uniref:Uncharacterized protein n=1 Tax=Caenorhabditis remanei TaxID=31234 RepID=A0A6A5GQM3_CAERE|nr:hypothetical protein GCK72_013426 [Caenorhabditis remanei]KAF1756971.1 hypothetical protein GCK72_013426 [Caenorhabditis remanei]
MDTITQLQQQLDASKAEIESLRSDIYIKDRKIKHLEIKEKYGYVKRTTARRHLGLEVTQLEVNRLNEKIAVLREESIKKDDQLEFHKSRNEKLCSDLSSEREKVECLTRSIERNFKSSGDGTDDSTLFFLSSQLRRTRDELKNKEEELTTVRYENLSCSLKSFRETKRLENEINELKRDNELLRNQMKDLQKEMNAKEMKSKETIRQWSNRNKDLQIDVNLHKMTIEELEYQLADLKENCENQTEWNHNLKSMEKTIKLLELN